MSHCVLCNTQTETRDHLFFSCTYSSMLWSSLARKLLQNQFSTDWQTLINVISKTYNDRLQTYLVRSSFQLAVHSIWREQNGRKHGEKPTPVAILAKWMDKQMRNKLSVIRKEGDNRYELDLQTWFSTSSD